MNQLRSLIRLIINNKKARIITISSAVAILLLCSIVGIVITHIGSKDTASTSSPGAVDITDSDFTYISPVPENQATPTDFPEPVIDEEVTSFVPATEMDLEPSSLTVLVNKEHPLPQDYRPDNLVTPNIRFDILTYDERTLLRSEAAKAMERLFAAAESDGYILYGVSGYRSYARQFKIFTNNIATQGKEHTLKYSAVPGTSEHQTGLSMDVSIKSLNYKLDEVFADTPEGKWLAENAYKYGFTIRYPKDKEDITGYAYEPWHVRYVGRGLSYYLYNNNLTLEEYYHYTPDPNFDFEALYADIINYVIPSITMSITPSGEPITATPTVTGKGTKPGHGSDPGDTDNSDSSGQDTGATPVPTPTQGAELSGIPTDNGNSDNQDSTSDQGTLDILIE